MSMTQAQARRAFLALSSSQQGLLGRLARADLRGEGVNVSRAKLVDAEHLERTGLALWVDLRVFVVSDKGRVVYSAGRKACRLCRDSMLVSNTNTACSCTETIVEIL